MQLAQKRKQQPNTTAAQQHPLQIQLQRAKQQQQQQRKKQRIVELQKGPVKVAVLPAVTAAGAGAAAAAGGASLRQQLLGGGQLQRSATMLQPTGRRPGWAR
jgi:hypothetical protein